MAVEAKPFQQATIEAAVATFVGAGPRRFLVADEVGLGKTVVARGVVERMCEGRSRPLRVFYVCSNLAIGAQNLGRLVSFLPDGEIGMATAKVDRPSLMPTRVAPQHPDVQVYSLTPDTALPARRRGRAEGRQEERAFGLALLDELLGRRIPGSETLLRVRASEEGFAWQVDRFATAIREGRLADRDFLRSFREALRKELGVAPRKQLPAEIRRLVNDEGGRQLVRSVRSALAVAALRRVRPDLVVLDEFQRFRDFLADAENTDRDEKPTTPERRAEAEARLRVLLAIRGETEGRRTPHLLLSATPYTPFGSADDRGKTGGDFFAVVEYLYGGGRRGREAAGRARELFGELEDELLKGSPLSGRARRSRAALTDLLTHVLSRTERPRSEEGAEDGAPRDAVLATPDVSVFRHLAESLSSKDAGWAVPLWRSVPLPMQALGGRYKVWRRADKTLRAPGRIELTREHRDGFGEGDRWAHPGFRALLEAMPVRRLALPWVAPSLPWWGLSGDWRAGGRSGTVDGKLLVFSRFRAVPLAVSGLVSYAVEAWLQSRRSGNVPTYGKAMRTALPADPRRPALLALFHPSPLLAQADPVARGLGSLRRARSAVRSQLRELLAEHGVRVDGRASGRGRPPWALLAAAEGATGHWDASASAWRDVLADSGSRSEARGRLAAVVARWEEAARTPLRSISGRELTSLAALALEAPGVVLARALARHWDGALGQQLATVAGLSWRGLRSYLDGPWFAAGLGKGGHYPDRLRRAVVEGNLESVLDEHFWYISMARGQEWRDGLAELETALRLTTGTVRLHRLGAADETVALRCHAAVALNEARAAGRRKRNGWTEAEESPLRPDEVRRAFNGPFWPHVVVTTSIGQEGLDFHPWCKALAHWDVCSGPVALEQREGRVSRFAGLSVRRAIAERLSTVAIDGRSPGRSCARKPKRS